MLLISVIASQIGSKFSLHAQDQQGITEGIIATGISKDLLFDSSSNWWPSEGRGMDEVFMGFTVLVLVWLNPLLGLRVSAACSRGRESGYFLSANQTLYALLKLFILYFRAVVINWFQKINNSWHCFYTGRETVRAVHDADWSPLMQSCSINWARLQNRAASRNGQSRESVGSIQFLLIYFPCCHWFGDPLTQPLSVRLGTGRGSFTLCIC